MAHDNAGAAPQPVLEPAARGIALPVPRPPVLEPPARDTASPAPRPPVLEPATQDIARGAPQPEARPVPRPVHTPRAGWTLLIVVAAAAAWVAGWLAGVSWAWRAMTPRYMLRTHRRTGADLVGAGSPLRS